MTAGRSSSEYNMAANGSTDLSRRMRALIRTHWSEVTRHLVPPTIAWKWGDCQVSHRVKYNWKESGLIIRAPGGDRWQTTEALWLYVIKQAADDEYVGVEIQGQELLPVDVKPELETRVLADTIPTPPNTQRQVTLSGNPLTDSTDIGAEELADAVRENQLKDPTRPDGRERAAQHPRQTRLQTDQEHARSVWEFDTTHDGTTGGVVQPAGSVY